jgi:hypothetical protein
VALIGLLRLKNDLVATELRTQSNFWRQKVSMHEKFISKIYIQPYLVLEHIIVIPHFL